MWGSPIVPRNVARIRLYVKNSGCSSSPPIGPNGRPQWAPSAAARSTSWGAAAPAGKASTVPEAISWSPGSRVSGPATRRPSTSPSLPAPDPPLVPSPPPSPSPPPDTCTVTASSTVITTSTSTSTAVASANTGGASWISGGMSSRCQWASSTIAGTEIAVTFTQYWNACTNVMPRMPPSATLAVMTPPTTTTPTQYGVPISTDSVTPAPFIWGSR
jgi:hypothetical protein